MLDQNIPIFLYNSVSEENAERVFENWHASSIAMCPRAHYFKRLGVQPINKPTGAKILRWSAGHNIEAAIRPHIEKLYEGVGSNERMTSEKMSLTGEFDNYTEKLKTLIEIKSVSDFAFLERNGQTGLKDQIGSMANGNKRWGLKNTPYYHHELQQHCYVLLLRELGKPIEFIDYVYISLNGRIVGYKTEVQQAMIDEVRTRLSILNEAWAKQVPPDCICDQKDHPCYNGVMAWCDFQNGNECCSLDLIEEVKE